MKGIGSAILRWSVYISAIVTMGVVAALLVYILIKGLPNLSWELFSWQYTSDNVSMLPAIINTISITILALLFTIPVGVGAAIYMVEYAGDQNQIVRIVRTMAETLSGIPSIVYGLFGYLVFVTTLKMKYCMLAGALTLAIMTLPTIMRTTEEALKAVPDGYREGSYGLGAGRLRTVFRIVLPTAVPGILSGVILSIGRMVGETAALLFTASTTPQIAGLFDSSRTLAVHMYCLLSEGLYTEQAYATAVILLVLIILLNCISKYMTQKYIQ